MYDELTKPSEYRYVIMKITSKGVVSWSQIIRGEVREDTKYATKNNAYIYGLAVDENDNIYVGVISEQSCRLSIGRING